MLFTIERDAFKRALGFTARLAPNRATMPILNCLHVTASADTVTLHATDMTVWGRDTAEARVDADGAAAVPADRLRAIVDNAPEGSDLEVAVDAEGAKATVKVGRSRFRLACFPADDFPPFPSLEAAAFNIAPESLARAVQEVAPAISRDETRYYLNGIYLEADDRGDLTAVATDGHRLHACPIPQAGVSQWPGVIVPRDAVGAIERACADAESTVSIATDGRRLELWAGTRTLVFQLIEGSFPDWQRVVPERGDGLVLNRYQVMAAVNRVTPFGAADKSKAIYVRSSDQGLEILAHDQEGNAAREIVEVERGAAKVEVGVNGKYALEALRTLEGASVRLTYRGGESPMRLDPLDLERDTLRVVMPVRAAAPSDAIMHDLNGDS